MAISHKSGGGSKYAEKLFFVDCANMALYSFETSTEPDIRNLGNKMPIFTLSIVLLLFINLLDKATAITKSFKLQGIFYIIA